MVKVGINGFGRIGRLILRAALADAEFSKDSEVVGINDLYDAKTLAHLFKYDSVHGRYNGEVKAEGDSISIDGKAINVSAVRDPAELPWSKLGVDIAIESTGLFRDRNGASKHFKAGANKVIISAPAIDPDVTIVMGVNHEDYKPEHKIISNASCTTNALAPMAKVLNDSFGIERGFLTTVHAYTGDQRILDMGHTDLRRARAAAVSIIPTTTGAAKAISLVIPELAGKLDGISLRVPAPNVSVNDFVVSLKKEATKEDINKAFKSGAEGELKGIMEYTEEPIVSIDVNDNPHSVVFDALSTSVMGGKGKFAKLLGWYDNEWGFSCRMIDLMKYIS